MNESEPILTVAPHEKRYLRILRDTIRRELEVRVEKHLVDGNNLNHYLDELGIQRNIPLHEKSFGLAKRVVEECKPINDWFVIDEFWQETEPIFSSERGTTAYQTVLARLLVRLHGFWVFALDDTSHTFRFIESPHKSNEWGESENKQGNVENVETWPDTRIHLGNGIYYRGGSGMKDILQSALKHYLLRPARVRWGWVCGLTEGSACVTRCVIFVAQWRLRIASHAIFLTSGYPSFSSRAR